MRGEKEGGWLGGLIREVKTQVCKGDPLKTTKKVDNRRWDR